MIRPLFGCVSFMAGSHMLYITPWAAKAINVVICLMCVSPDMP
jgi:hypothetical protein